MYTPSGIAQTTTSHACEYSCPCSPAKSRARHRNADQEYAEIIPAWLRCRRCGPAGCVHFAFSASDFACVRLDALCTQIALGLRCRTGAHEASRLSAIQASTVRRSARAISTQVPRAFPELVRLRLLVTQASGRTSLPYCSLIVLFFSSLLFVYPSSTGVPTLR